MMRSLVIQPAALILRIAPWLAAMGMVLADAQSTEAVLALGGYEANPLMAPFVEAGLLWPVTLAIVALIAYVGRPLMDMRQRFESPHLLLWITFAAVAAWRYAVVLNNLDVASQLALLSAT
jgi:hypothetical protein